MDEAERGAEEVRAVWIKIWGAVGDEKRGIFDWWIKICWVACSLLCRPRQNNRKRALDDHAVLSSCDVVRTKERCLPSPSSSLLRGFPLHPSSTLHCIRGCQIWTSVIVFIYAPSHPSHSSLLYHYPTRYYPQLRTTPNCLHAPQLCSLRVASANFFIPIQFCTTISCVESIDILCVQARKKSCFKIREPRNNCTYRVLISLSFLSIVLLNVTCHSRLSFSRHVFLSLLCICIFLTFSCHVKLGRK